MLERIRPADSVRICRSHSRSCSLFAEILRGRKVGGLNAVARLVIARPRSSLVAGVAVMALCGLFGADAACRELPDTVGAVLRTGRWQVVGRADSTLNLIPVDRVAAAAVEIASATTTSEIYHLTNVNNCRIGDLAGALADVFGIQEPGFAATRDDFTDVDRLVDTALGEYRPYAFGDKRFDVTHDPGWPHSFAGTPSTAPHREAGHFRNTATEGRLSWSR
ncbi:hypothetical protein [Nocardia terpenica]|nr:hypothetical protein [Nocardia terpenica]NQE85876.1 hypothetical protein [Nocardia terpenica]